MSDRWAVPRAAIFLALQLCLVSAAFPQSSGNPVPRQVNIGSGGPNSVPGFFVVDPAGPFGRKFSPAGTDTLPPAASDSTVSDSTVSDSTASDSTVSDSAASNSAVPTISGTPVDPPRGSKSSWTAVGLSAILPGAGQVYTENYWKVPVILGLGGYWVYEWTKNNDQYRQFRDLYSRSIADSPPFGDERYLSLREFYKDQRDSFSWYIGLLYFLNVVDAYVGAELYDFDVGPDLGSGGGGMQATLRFHL